MRVLELVMSVVVTLTCSLDATAQEPFFLVDRSGSTSQGAGPIIERALSELGETFIEIVLWNNGTTGTMYGNAVTLATDLPPSTGSTLLGSALSEYSKDIECGHLIVIVDGRSDDMYIVQVAAGALLERRNRLTMLVITTVPATLRQYENMSSNGNYSVRALKVGVMYEVYQAALLQDACVVNLG